MEILGNLLSISLYEGLAYGFVAIGVYITFRVLSFPDLTVDGSFPLGGSIAAILIIHGVNPWVATATAVCAGGAAGLCTALLNTKLRINALLAGILMMVALYSINLLIMGRANIPLLFFHFTLPNHFPNQYSLSLRRVSLKGSIFLFIPKI